MLTWVCDGLISAAPAERGMLFEFVERGKGCADGGLWAVICSVHRCGRLVALVIGRSVDPVGLGGSTGDELESLILAQNERWRHA